MDHIQTEFSLRALPSTQVTSKMKITLAVFALLTVGFAFGKPQIDSRDLGSELMLSLVECLRNMMINGNDALGMPVLEPLESEEISIDLGGLSSDMAGHITATNFRADSLTKWINDQVVGSIGIILPTYSMDLVLRFEELSLSSGYDTIFHSPVDGLDLFGTGTILLDVRNLVAKAYVRISVLTISFSDFSLFLSLCSVADFEITGVNKDEEFSTKRAERINQLARDFVLNVGQEDEADGNSVFGEFFTTCLFG